MADNYVNIHLHTEYSFLDGFGRIWDDAAKQAGSIIVRLKEINAQYCAMTDHGNTAGWVRWEKACNKNGIKPIFGIEGYFCDDINRKGLTEKQKIIATRGMTTAEEKKKAIKLFEKKHKISKRAHFVALAMNDTGIYEILKTLTIASVKGFYHRPRWDFAMIKAMKNCIFGTACAGGILNYYLNDNYDNYDRAYLQALEEAERWKKVLGDRFYIELQPIDWSVQAKNNLFCHQIAKDLDIPCYLSNDCHYPNPSDWEAHDILLALQSSYGQVNKQTLNDPNRMRYDMHDLFIKDRKQMFDSFYKHNKNYSEVFVNGMLDITNEIAERCTYKLIKKKMIMPNIKVDTVEIKNKSLDGKSDIIRYLWHLVEIGWKNKVEPYVAKDQWPVYKKQISYELGQIINQGFTPYFILCNRLMKWVDEKDIARGPARGSSCGSLVAYLLNITMVDPIPHKLLFSRFIDPNRTDFPDVDMDFEDTRRREVVQYFIDTYGRNNVAILANNMSYKPKLCIKDVSRLYDVPLSEVQHLCDLVVTRSGADSRLSFCLEDTFKQFAFAQDFAKKYPKVAQFTKQIEGMTKSQGVHAAAVVIADGDIMKYTALKRDKKNPEFFVSYVDKSDCEDLGILKMDVLGLNTMSILQECRKLVKERHNVIIDFEGICRDVTYNGGDDKVYKEFADGYTTGIFQFNSPGLTRLSVQVGIERFSELSDCTALHRPSGIKCLDLNQEILRENYDEEGTAFFENIPIGEFLGKRWGIVVYDNKKDNLCIKEGIVHKTGVQKVYKVKMKSGKELICTGNERFNVGGGKYEELKNLALGSKVYYI